MPGQIANSQNRLQFMGRRSVANDIICGKHLALLWAQEAEGCEQLSTLAPARRYHSRHLSRA